jgi:hypothetical protein
MIFRAVLLMAVLMTAPALPAWAQSIGCREKPVGPMIDLKAVVGTSRQGGTSQTGTSTQSTTTTGSGTSSQTDGTRRGAIVDFGRVPMYGTTCEDDTPPPADILHGAPPPRGGSLLNENPGRDILRGGP